VSVARAPRPRAVEVATREGVGWITLARPETGNACDAELMGALAAACDAVADDDGVRVVVLEARGPRFSVGLPRGHRWPDATWPDGAAALGGLAKPALAALHGETRGWGLAIALACDLRIASTAATLVVSALAPGAFPGGGVTQRLARTVGVARALELVLLGTPLAAAQAAEWGLVNAVVTPARLHATVDAVARRLAARGPLALRLAKEAVVRALDLPLADGIRLEEDLYVLSQTTEDRREGVRAFLDKRPPRFTGR
jgi:enoyl-CoA hydratase/carnithine racemase